MFPHGGSDHPVALLYCHMLAIGKLATSTGWTVRDLCEMDDCSLEQLIVLNLEVEKARREQQKEREKRRGNNH